MARRRTRRKGGEMVQAEKKEAGHRRPIHLRSNWTYSKIVSALERDANKHFRSLRFPSHTKY